MIILYIRKFFDRCVEFIFSMIIMLVNKIIFQRIEISFHRQAADFYKLYDDRQAGDRALVFNVGKIPGINVHLFG